MKQKKQSMQSTIQQQLFFNHFIFMLWQDIGWQEHTEVSHGRAMGHLGK